MKWQYKWVELNPVSDGMDALNALGAQEWEVIAMDADYLLLKRPVKQAEDWLAPKRSSPVPGIEIPII